MFVIVHIFNFTILNIGIDIIAIIHFHYYYEVYCCFYCCSFFVLIIVFTIVKVSFWVAVKEPKSQNAIAWVYSRS